ncbi:MAG: metallophosphoesterase [Myxococcales bacterium]|nr:metallophosphoesterase [Myxococcales bacterium]
MIRFLALTLVLCACAPEVPNTCASRPDVVDPCGPSPDGGVAVKPGTPDAGAVPGGSVGLDGGTVERLWFATTGDTRPHNCDDTASYPKAAIAQIAAAMKALRVQFTVDLGDHMYVCNADDAEAATQMGYYMTGIASGPSTWWMTMGNHECGNTKYPYSCFVGGAHDANFAAYIAALNRPLPYYFTDVQTASGLARFVMIADDSWDQAQSAWLSSTLGYADAHAKYTIVARHHPVQGTRTGAAEILSILEAHKESLILTAHNHDYEHDLSTWSARSTVVGLGGAGYDWGFATVLQNPDGTLTFVQRDANGNPIGAPWSVSPQ